jgi:hypothetical protein
MNSNSNNGKIYFNQAARALSVTSDEWNIIYGIPFNLSIENYIKWTSSSSVDERLKFEDELKEKIIAVVKSHWLDAILKTESASLFRITVSFKLKTIYVMLLYN